MLETISIKLDNELSQRMKRLMKEFHYLTKSEFIREAIRDHMKRLRNEELDKKIQNK